jgi:hypothetical protein
MERIFALSSILVMPFWFLMVLAPRWRWTRRIVESPFIVAGAALLYVALLVPRLLAVLPAVARPELSAIAALLGTPAGATIAWAHFLALDLFAGRWIFLDAQERGLSSWVVSPLLVLTLLFAPLGLGVYLGVRGAAATKAGAAVREFARAVWEGSRPAAIVTLASLGLLVVSLALSLVDSRIVVGAPVWLKPAKFAAAIAVSAPVLAWIVGQLATRRARVAGAVIAVVSALELVIITVQAVRGVPSHFNAATPLDTTLFAVMGAMITVLWLAEAYLTVRTFRQRFATPARTWGIRLGLAAALFGGGIGFLMPRPTPTQLATLEAGQPTPLLGAHSVGVPDGGPGLPVTRWSLEGGDLRVPHFFGLHALQVLPLLAFFLERRRGNIRLLLGAAAGWIGITGVTLWQALRGQPLVRPDVLTLVALGVVAALALLPLVWRRPAPAAELAVART